MKDQRFIGKSKPYDYLLPQQVKPKSKVSRPQQDQPLHSFRWPQYPPPQQERNEFLDSSHAESEHLPDHSCSPELSSALTGPEHVVYQW